LLQRAINRAVPGNDLEVDGVVGSKTIDAINRATPEQLKPLNAAIVDLRGPFYEGVARNQPGKAKFLHGWKNRNESFDP
jgi:lysozyme family protein